LKSRCWRFVRDRFWMATGRNEPAQEIARVVGDHRMTESVTHTEPWKLTDSAGHRCDRGWCQEGRVACWARARTVQSLWSREAYSVEGLREVRHLRQPGMATFDCALT